MNDHHDEAPLDPVERELAERLARGDDADERAGDSEELRAAAAWVPRLDALLRDAEGAGAQDPTAAPDPLAVRDAVLARIGAGSVAALALPARAARTARPALPWWRTAAPVALAAGLAGLFLWQEFRGEDPVPEAPSPAMEMRSETSPGTAGRDEDHVRSEEKAALPMQSLQSAPLARRTIALAPPHIEAESLVTVLLRDDLDPEALDRVRMRLTVLSRAVADTAFAARIERILADRAPGPR